MAMLDHRTADRLGKLLGLLGSDHDGERAAAGLKAHRLLTDAGMTWAALVQAAMPKPQHAEPLHGTWRQTCRDCLGAGQPLRAWERGFLTDLPNFRRLSTKQRYVLNEIAERLGVRPPRQ